MLIPLVRTIHLGLSSDVVAFIAPARVLDRKLRLAGSRLDLIIVLKARSASFGPEGIGLASDLDEADQVDDQFSTIAADMRIDVDAALPSSYLPNVGGAPYPWVWILC